MSNIHTPEKTVIPDPTQEEPSGQVEGNESASQPSSWLVDSPKILVQGLAFGLVFGFLLQKGGVAKFDILIGQLLLEDFTVVKVMLSAVVVGMVGVYFLERRGMVEYQIKETRLGSNIVGGLLFGVGFGLLAYCPGTDAAAVGQGNFDAIVGILGMVAGSYLYALSSGVLEGWTTSWSNLGKLTLSQVTGLPRGLFIALFAPLLVALLVLIDLLL